MYVKSRQEKSKIPRLTNRECGRQLSLVDACSYYVLCIYEENTGLENSSDNQKNWKAI